MRRLVRSSVATALLALISTGTAVAEIPLVFHIFRQDYCPAAEQQLPTPHNEGITIVQVVPNNDFSELPRVAFGIIYEIDGNPPEQRGRINAKVEVQFARGGVRRVGKLKARQQADGTAEKFKFKNVELQEGDRIVWNVRFRGFAPLGTCFLLEGGIIDPDGL